MSQTFVEGRRVTVTKVLAGPCVVTQVKTQDKEGYYALQLGYGEKRVKNITKALEGHLKKVIKDKKAPRFLAEVRFASEPKKKDGSTFNVGEVITFSDIFNVGDLVAVTGISKGKGFAGVVKRWHFAGGPRTHGQSDRERAPGATSGGTTPGRVRKNKKMAGHMGVEKVTIKNLQVVSTDPETNTIELSGPVPGITGGLLIVKRISAGKLEGIQEVQAQVVEGEPEAADKGQPPAGNENKTKAKEEAKTEGGTLNA